MGKSLSQGSLLSRLSLPNSRVNFSVILALLFAGILQSCTPGTLVAAAGSSATGLSAGPEPANCLPKAPITNPIAISGHGDYYYRPTSLVAGSQGLYGNPVSAFIRYAEVAIYDGSNNLVQCGKTDNNGDFSLQIPNVVGTYNVLIFSRSTNGSAEVNASVLEDIYSSAPYSISSPFTIVPSSTSVAVGSLTAFARVSEAAKIPGGAFFIFDNILYANERIRALTGNGSFVAPKVQAYWKAGFNPYTYYGKSSLASFYVNGDRKLYILGGNNGDVKNTDTDHFDASVIDHEYGHFLEDVYGKSESPGGSHNGNAIIDPRLAWSEGWGNYIQAQLLNGRYFTAGYYVDTIGFRGDTLEGSGTSAGLAFKLNLAEDGATATYDAVSVAGEGTFREMSISRTLYKTTRTPASNVSGLHAAAVPFVNIWNAFTSTGSGFGTSSGVVFRSIGYLNEFLAAALTGANLTNWTTNVLPDEQQNTSRKDFADPVTKSPTCATLPKDITPVMDAFDSSGYARSNWLRSHDYYSFYYNGSGSQVMNLTYSQVGTQTINLDLVIFKTNFIFYDDDQDPTGASSSSYIAVQSRRLNPAVETGSEQISMSGLAPGYYLIDVRAVTYNKTTSQRLTTSELNGTARYNLQLVTNGTTTEYLCPAH